MQGDPRASLRVLVIGLTKGWLQRGFAHLIPLACWEDEDSSSIFFNALYNFSAPNILTLQHDKKPLVQLVLRKLAVSHDLPSVACWFTGKPAPQKDKTVKPVVVFMSLI